MLQKWALALIRGYQKWVSPLTPPACRFAPTCSHYTYTAISRFGFWRGGWLGIKRIVRCQPFCQGGFDPVPLPDDGKDMDVKDVETYPENEGETRVSPVKSTMKVSDE